MRKLLTLCVTLMGIVLSVSFVGCSAELPYHPEFYENAVSWIREDFQNENHVKGVEYGFDAEDAEQYPETRTFIVSDEAEYKRIFLDDIAELDVDLAEKTLIVYTFAAEYVLPAKIVTMYLNDDVLTVEYEIELIPETGSAVKPFQRWFILKLDKTDFSSVNFVER